MFWSLAGETYASDGDLGGAVWGVPQLERMQKLYQTRAKAIAHWEESGAYDSLFLGQKAEMDALLLELPCPVESIHIRPSDADIHRRRRKNGARYDSAALDACECRIAFMLANMARRHDFQFPQEEKVLYHVQLLFPMDRSLRAGALIGRA